MASGRIFPIGSEVVGKAGVTFRVWAPRSRSVSVVLGANSEKAEGEVPLRAEGNGYFSGAAPHVSPGTNYRLRLDHGLFPDPASRFQPDGPHGPSQVVTGEYAWTDAAWRGRAPREFVIYELHIGTFTPEGSWRSAMVHLPELARIGITVLEVMPIADFPGKFGWGYDGVNLFAPTRLYGTPDDVRAFVNRAHELGLMVILDV